MTRTLALVESPVQLLNALEWAHWDAQGSDRGEGGPVHLSQRHPSGAGARHLDLSIAVLQPLDPVTRAQLATLAELGRAEGAEVTAYDPRGGPAGRARALAALGPKVARARRLLLGDPFSGLIQTLLPLSRATDLVVVDDGTATVELVDLLATGRPLVRWHREGKGSAAAGFAARRLAPDPRRRLELFTSLAVDPPPWVRGSANRYEWTRSRFGPPQILPGSDLLGSSLVETGVVTLDCYLDTVTQLAADHRVGRYFAHRREHSDKLQRIASATGAEIVRPQLPLEIEARRGPVAGTLLSFPSTVVHTLPLILAGTGVRVKICAVDAGWLTPTASARSLSFLTDVSASARSRHGLEMISPVTA